VVNKLMIKDFVNKIINLIKSKDYKGALIEIENYSDSSYPHNNNPILLYYLAFIKDRLNEKEKALEILNLLTKKKPDFTEAHHLSSNINEDLKRYDISKKILETLIKKIQIIGKQTII
jgi:tetratricopeptide (TPR) repeat protein